MSAQLTTTEKKSVSTLLTLTPEQYVAEVFNPFRAELALLKAEAEGITYDITTTAGMKIATEHRAKFRQVRVDAEKARKERKAPILEIGKLLDSRYKELEAEISPLESRFDSDIKAEEARKEAERQAKIKAEQERVAAIQAKIDWIRSQPLKAIGMPAASIRHAAQLVADTIIDESFAEFRDEAMAVRSEAFNKLESAAAAAEVQEAEAARIKAEREELARLRAEAEARRAADEAKAKAEREAAQAELQAARDKHNAEVAAQRAELEQRQRDIARQQAVLEAAQRRREEEEAAAHAASIAQDVAPRALEALAEQPSDNGYVPDETWPFPSMGTAAPVSPPTLRLGVIAERLGFALSADFLRELGFEPADKQRGAVLYHEHQFPGIGVALIKRIEQAMAAHRMAEAA
jgi:hypothetical protein